MKQQSAIAAVRREARASLLSSIIMVGVANGNTLRISENDDGGNVRGWGCSGRSARQFVPAKTLTNSYVKKDL